MITLQWKLIQMPTALLIRLDFDEFICTDNGHMSVTVN